MSAENKAVMQRLIEGFNTGNLSVYDELVAPDFVDQSAPPGIPANREAWKQKAVMFRSAFPDIQVTIEHAIAEGDLVTTHTMARGIHQGELMGIPASGKEIAVRGLHIEQIVDGKITARWEVIDIMGMMVQLGVISPPGA
jgi:steroid delta-isomerase-like uncharacterized protein